MKLRKLAFVLPIAISLTFAACGGNNGGSLPSAAPAVEPSANSAVNTSSNTLSSAYATTIMNDQPTAYYHLDDTTQTVLDSSGNGFNGWMGYEVTRNAPGLVASMSDTAIETPGIAALGGVVHIGPHPKLNPSSAVSLEALIRFTSTPADHAVPIEYGERSSTAPYGWFFEGGHLVAQFTLSSGVLTVQTPNALSTNQIYDVVSTFDGTNACLYVNGSLVASASKNGTLTNYLTGYGLTIGDSASYSDPAFNGSVDEVAVYAGKALTATQVNNHYLAATASSPAPSPSASPSASPAPTASPRPTPTASPRPTPTASPQPTPTPSGGNVATYYGCPVFTAGDYYNAPITNAPVDPESANYINGTIQAGDHGAFYASTGVEKVNGAISSTPMLKVKQDVSYHSFSSPYPWQSPFFIEPLSDRHAMVVQTQSCHLYESYGTRFSSGVLSAFSGSNWDLTKAFVPMTPGQPSSMASGLSMFAGMVKWEDYESGAIRHALNFAAVAHTVAQYKFVRPASDTDQITYYGSSSYQLPYGAHLRLKASFSTAGWGPEATMVANAMKTYGIYLADTGSSSNALYFANASDGTNPWDGRDLASLSKITLADFDVVELPTIQTVPGH